LLQDEIDLDESFEDDTDLVNVDGTKVKLSGKVLKVKLDQTQSVVFNLLGAIWIEVMPY